MADTAGPPRDLGLEPRVARLETDVAEIKSTLNRLAPRIDEMYGFLTAELPELATKAELIQLRSDTATGLADLRTEMKTEAADLRAEMADLRIEVMQRPTRRQSIFDVLQSSG
jgi:uncharacterized protein YceH (UPF0502 family)